MRRKIKGVAVKDVEADEIWGFVGCKNRHKLHKGITDPQVGDAYTFVGIERNTKLILAWHLGERGMVDSEAFTEKLTRCDQRPLPTDHRWFSALRISRRVFARHSC